jgi:hypothetical protein
MILPKIVYNAGSGSVTLNFSYPPVQKPGTDEKTATRHDVESSSGILQTVVERVVTFRTVQLDFVPQADLAAWSTFMDWALSGGVFTYYPDATVSGTHDDWQLSDTSWTPAYAFRTFAKFKLKMRKVI